MVECLQVTSCKFQVSSRKLEGTQKASFSYYGRVAQLVERRFEVPEVVDSRTTLTTKESSFNGRTPPCLGENGGSIPPGFVRIQYTAEVSSRKLEATQKGEIIDL